MKRMMNTRLSVWLMITLVMLALLTAPLLAKEHRGLETESPVPNERQDRTKSSERSLEFVFVTGPLDNLDKKVYLPMVFRYYTAPWITVTVNGYQAQGEVGPPSFCNADYKVALYAKTDIWYVQPYDDWRRDIPINPDCTWEPESEIAEWDQVAAHLVLASYSHPSTIRRTSYCPPRPLDPATNPNVLAASCSPKPILALLELDDN